MKFIIKTNWRSWFKSNLQTNIAIFDEITNARTLDPIEKEFLEDSLRQQEMTEAEAGEVFSLIQSKYCNTQNIVDCIDTSTEAPRNSPNDIGIACFVRAHSIKEIIKTKGFSCKKIFIFGALFFEHNGKDIQWDVHCATVIRVNNNGKRYFKIIDPLVSPKKLLDISEWFALITKPIIKDDGSEFIISGFTLEIIHSIFFRPLKLQIRASGFEPRPTAIIDEKDLLEYQKFRYEFLDDKDFNKKRIEFNKSVKTFRNNDN